MVAVVVIAVTVVVAAAVVVVASVRAMAAEETASLIAAPETSFPISDLDKVLGVFVL